MLVRRLTITVPKGTGFKKDVSGNRGQMWQSCFFRNSVRLQVDQDWLFVMDGQNCQLTVPFVRADLEEYVEPEDVE